MQHGVNGLLCEPGDPESFADGVVQLTKDPDLRRELSRNARAWAEERSWDAAFEPLVATYEELAGR